LGALKPRTVWDLGANMGVFSRIAADRGIFTIACDSDPSAVELDYLKCITEKRAHLLPLLLDLTNPSPGIGWAHHERASLEARGPADTVMALALVHHLAIANNTPLDAIGKYLHTLGNSLIIEFVPKNDPNVQRLLSTREDIFPEYTEQHFETALNRYFIIRKKVPIPASPRILYTMVKR
ncbi:MAG: SAM-dependent methyltransferase, partial [Candidatus Aureabacteria bacterium]|nr:SAM-dependent methyltransferase [Candidatus Auribacterota bacterium]